MRVPAQDLRQQSAQAAADVDNAANIREVVGLGQGGCESCGSLGHGGVEGDSAVGVLGEELEETHSEADVQARLAGPDRIQDVRKGLDAADRLQENGPCSHACGNVAAQPIADGRQAEGSGLNLVEYAERGQQAKYAVQRRLVDAGDLGQIPGADGAVDEEVGDPQLGHRVDGPRAVDPPDDP
jgi:hypothetical protein